MAFRIMGGLFILLLGLGALGKSIVSDTVIGCIGIIAGLSLLAGL